jgi:abortive infection bacteriophage resistance protein
LSVLRNITAHHSRIWERADIQYTPPVLKRLQTDPDASVYQRTPWAWIVIVADLADTIRRNRSYSAAFMAYIDTHPDYINGLKRPSVA